MRYIIEKTPSKKFGIYKNGKLIYTSACPSFVETKIENETEKMMNLGINFTVVNKCRGIMF